MPTSRISIDRVLSRLDEYLHKNDYAAAERHLLYWLTEAETNRDRAAELPIRNELMGLYRKLGRREEALAMADAAKARIDAWGIGGGVGAATTHLNCATVYKAFDMAEVALPMFEEARAVYESALDKNDTRLSGLYNNMALALVDLHRFREADALYEQAIAILERSENGSLEVAITLLNLASAREAELGLEAAGICDIEEMCVQTWDVDYTHLAKIQNMAGTPGVNGGFSIEEIRYTDVVSLDLACVPEDAEGVISQLTNVTAGRGTLKTQESRLVKRLI